MTHHPQQRPDQALEQALRQAVVRTPVDALLLSGGLDSSVLAALARPPLGITVGLDETETARFRCARCADCPIRGCNADLGWAGSVTRALGITWQPLVLTVAESLDALDTLVWQRRSFDLGLLNDIPILAGMRHAASRGARDIWTGDDADTLFGGYRFLRGEPDWSAYLARRIPTIAPEAGAIGSWLGLRPRFPYLHEAVLAVARSLRRDDIETWRESPEPPSFVDGFDPTLMARPRKPWGKVVLRRVAARLLPETVAWRPKTDLQFGAGTCRLETPLAALVTAADRPRLDATGIAWFNDAHRGLYLRFERQGLTIPPPIAGEPPCPSCGAGLPHGHRHCRTCGFFEGARGRGGKGARDEG